MGMAEKESGSRLAEERREARRESDLVRQLRAKADLSDGGTALKIYNKVIQDKLFHTLVGYAFMEELREVIIDSGVAEEGELADLPEAETADRGQTGSSMLAGRRDRYQKMYEGQKLLNKKLKIGIAALVILLIGFVAINFKFEYSIFTFFTNYKANMEEELIDKYKNWEIELQERQQALEQKEGADQDG